MYELSTDRVFSMPRPADKACRSAHEAKMNYVEIGKPPSISR